MQTANERVFNVTRRFSLKWKQAVKAVENCSCVWVEPNKTVRDVKDFAELSLLRAERAKRTEPIPFAEIPGLIYQPAERNLAQTRAGYELLAQANRFCLEAQ